MLLVMCMWEKQFIIQVEKRGSLSVLQAELSSLSLGMFGKCEWWSVPQAGPGC